MKYLLRKFEFLTALFFISCSMSSSKISSLPKNIVPSPLKDTDGRYSSCLFNQKWQCDYTDSLPGKTETHPELVECGKEGNVQERITDCERKNPKKFFYEGEKKGEGNWRLVTVLKSNEQIEIWKDERTQLIWSDSSSKKYNWYRSAGYAKPALQSIKETQFVSEPGKKDTSPFKIPHPLQPNPPVSVCVEAEILKTLSPYAFISASDPRPFKGKLHFPNILWKLPSRSEWMTAEVNGLRNVLPHLDVTFWTATSGSDYRNSAWTYHSDYGVFDGDGRYISNFVRCVGLEVK